ncbi:MAG: hypothetical protein ACLGIS_09795 [Actinomycetes bacterium]
MAAAEELAEGEGAMLDAIADGESAGAEELDVEAEPPQAVRLNRAAAATPATVKVVRLVVCISVLLGMMAFAATDVLSHGVVRTLLVGTCPWLVSHWVFGRVQVVDG